MELFERPSLRMPVECCLLTEEEMTYLSGGMTSQEILQAAAGICGSIALNIVYLLGSASFNSSINGVVDGYRDGMSIGQTTSHFWGNQTAAGKVAAVLMVGCVGYYIGVEILRLYQSLQSILQQDSTSQSSAGATLQAAVAA